MSNNRNAGHGHVWERPDGMKARCGGPGLCRDCAADQMRLREVRSTMPWNELDIVMLLRAKDLASAYEAHLRRLRKVIEREGFDVMVDVDGAYSLRRRADTPSKEI